MSRPVGIVRFLGTNCDRDVWQAVQDLGLEPKWLWHEDTFTPADYSSIIVPGGFSYGDYLRCGALAAKAPVMKSVHEAAEKGFPILGICNGFQILCETKLLPGALVRNESQRFIDRWVELKLENGSSWTNLEPGHRVRLPIAHGEGRFYIEPDELKALREAGQIWWSYTNDNPNGSLENIAGLMNKNKNVCALMPHPERAMFDWMGGSDGRSILGSILRVQ